MGFLPPLESSRRATSAERLHWRCEYRLWTTATWNASRWVRFFSFSGLIFLSAAFLIRKMSCSGQNTASRRTEWVFAVRWSLLWGNFPRLMLERITVSARTHWGERKERLDFTVSEIYKLSRKFFSFFIRSSGKCQELFCILWVICKMLRIEVFMVAETKRKIVRVKRRLQKKINAKLLRLCETI
jgi:hypothetical protein